MKLARSAILTALAQHLGEAVAKALSLDDVADDADLGAALISAFAPGIGDDAELSRVIVDATDGPSFILEAGDVSRHPLLRDWVSYSLSEAMAQPFSVGAQARDLYAWTPEFLAHQLADEGTGRLGGVIQMTWRAEGVEIKATAVYGAVTPHPAFGRHITLQGHALLLAGRMAREIHVAAPVVLPTEEGFALPERRTIH